jgi:ABC-type lipoprotein release transport system permease subunit
MEKLMDMFVYLVILIVLISSLVGGLIGAWLAIAITRRRHRAEIAHLDEGLKGCRYGQQYDPTYHAWGTPLVSEYGHFEPLPDGEGIRL